MVVTGDSNGTIMFFDKRLKLLYWYSRSIEKSIRSISFKQSPRKKFVVDESTDLDEIRSRVFSDCIEDRSQEYETLIKNKIPTDATLEHKPFVTRDFFICTFLLFLEKF